MEQVEEGCLLFRRLLGDDGLFLVGTKDVFVKEIVPGDLLMKWGSILIEIVLMGNI